MKKEPDYLENLVIQAGTPGSSEVRVECAAVLAGEQLQHSEQRSLGSELTNGSLK